MNVVDRHGRLTDETLEAFERAVVARPDLLEKFLADLSTVVSLVAVPAAPMAAGTRGALAKRALTDENLPEEVPAFKRPSERTR